MSHERSHIKSMTGFGRGAAEEGEVRFEVEIKGVNHRFLDARIRLPAEFLHLETDLRARLKRCVGRGRVEVVANLRSSRKPAQRVEIQVFSSSAISAEYSLSGKGEKCSSGWCWMRLLSSTFT